MIFFPRLVICFLVRSFKRAHLISLLDVWQREKRGAIPFCISILQNAVSYFIVLQIFSWDRIECEWMNKYVWQFFVVVVLLKCEFWVCLVIDARFLSIFCNHEWFSALLCKQCYCRRRQQRTESVRNKANAKYNTKNTIKMKFIWMQKQMCFYTLIFIYLFCERTQNNLSNETIKTTFVCSPAFTLENFRCIFCFYSSSIWCNITGWGVGKKLSYMKIEWNKYATIVKKFILLQYNSSKRNGNNNGQTITTATNWQFVENLYEVFFLLFLFTGWYPPIYKT